MGYEGVKYRLIRIDSSLPEDHRIDELKKWCTIFHNHKLAPPYPGGTHGNMSFRLRKGCPEIVITAANSSFAEILSDDSFFTVRKVDFKTLTVYAEGAANRKPSSEALLHYAIYQERPDIQAILHGHCKTITENADKMGITVTRKFVESGTLAIVESVLTVLNQHNFIEIRDHGFLALGKSIQYAGDIALQMLEKSKILV